MKTTDYSPAYKIFVILLSLVVTGIAFYRGLFPYGSTTPDFLSGICWGACSLVILILMSVFEARQSSQYDFINEWEEELSVTRSIEDGFTGTENELNDDDEEPTNIYSH